MRTRIRLNEFALMNRTIPLAADTYISVPSHALIHITSTRTTHAHSTYGRGASRAQGLAAGLITQRDAYSHYNYAPSSLSLYGMHTVFAVTPALLH